MLKSKIENEVETLKYIKDRIDIRPDVMIILGSGFGRISENTGTTTKLLFSFHQFGRNSKADPYYPGTDGVINRIDSQCNPQAV